MRYKRRDNTRTLMHHNMHRMRFWMEGKLWRRLMTLIFYRQVLTVRPAGNNVFHVHCRGLGNLSAVPTLLDLVRKYRLKYWM